MITNESLDTLGQKSMHDMCTLNLYPHTQIVPYIVNKVLLY